MVVTKLLRVIGLLVLLWLVLIVGVQIIGAATPLLAVSYMDKGHSQLKALDARVNVSALLLDVTTNRQVLNYTWKPEGEVALLVASRDRREVWVRAPGEPGRMLGSTGAFGSVNWSPDGDAIHILNPYWVFMWDAMTGQVEQQPLVDPLYTGLNVYVPLSSAEVLVLGKRESLGLAYFPYQLNLNTGVSVLAVELPCGDPSRVVEMTDGENGCIQQQRAALYLETGDEAHPLVTAAQIGMGGHVLHPQLSPDGTRVLFAYETAQSLPWSDYYTVRLRDGALRRLNVWGGNARDVQWLPAGVLRRDN